MKSSRLIALVAFSASACSNLSDSEFRGEDEPVCLDEQIPIEITTGTLELWPPNHKMHAISVADCAEVVSCDPDWTAEILWVSSDEPADGEHGNACEDDDDDDDDAEDDDATTSEDISLTGPDTVELRAERGGGGNGRVYTIAFVIRDAGGNEAESSCTVTVPHDQGKKGEAVDDGEAYRIEP